MIFLIPLVFLFIGFGLGGGLFYASRRMNGYMKSIEDARPCKAGDPGEGLVKLHGKVKAVDPNELLTSPMEQKRCVYYRLVIDQFQQTYISNGGPSSIRKTGGGGSWVPVIDDVQAIPMVVADETGEVSVDPLEAKLDFQQSRSHANVLTSLPADVEASLKERYKIVTKTWFLPKQMRYTESVIEQDQEVFVVGNSEVKDGKARLFKKDFELLMTFRNEKQVLRNGKIGSTICMILAVVFPVLFIALTIGVYHSMTTLGPQASQNAANVTDTMAKLRSMSLSERASAARQLAGMPVQKDQVRSVAPELNLLLDSKDASHRESAVRAIKQGWGSKVNEPALRRVLQNTKDARKQKELNEAISRLGS